MTECSQQGMYAIVWIVHRDLKNTTTQFSYTEIIITSNTQKRDFSGLQLNMKENQHTLASYKHTHN